MYHCRLLSGHWSTLCWNLKQTGPLSPGEDTDDVMMISLDDIMTMSLDDVMLITHITSLCIVM